MQNDALLFLLPYYRKRSQNYDRKQLEQFNDFKTTRPKKIRRYKTNILSTKMPFHILECISSTSNNNLIQYFSQWHTTRFSLCMNRKHNLEYFDNINVCLSFLRYSVKTRFYTSAINMLKFIWKQFIHLTSFHFVLCLIENWKFVILPQTQHSW